MHCPFGVMLCTYKILWILTSQALNKKKKILPKDFISAKHQPKVKATLIDCLCAAIIPCLLKSKGFYKCKASTHM